jgi:DNA-directed RNA polymerase subunit L
MISYFKGTPEYHVIRFKNGKIAQHGRGISFWYVPLGATIALVPVTSLDNPFIFTETTSNFQELAIQGSIAFRIVDPLKAAESYDFSSRSRGAAATGDGRQKIAERLVLAIQSHARRVISQMTLEEALAGATRLGETLTAELGKDAIVGLAGLSIESVHVSSLRPQPEIQQALQTDYREALQRKADEAIYGRRAHALEQERAIKEREVGTEIELAERRKTLVDTEARNKLKLAEAQVKAQEMELGVYSTVPANVVTALALKSWAEKGGAIGNLSITPDMLTSALAQLAAPGQGAPAAGTTETRSVPRTKR